jgi:hypothetical protein
VTIDVDAIRHAARVAPGPSAAALAVTVARPAEAIVDRLCGDGDTRPPRLRVAIEPAH